MTMATVPVQLINPSVGFGEDCVDARHMDYRKVVNTDIENTHSKDWVGLSVKPDLTMATLTKNGPEETFKKGHARRDSGHIVVEFKKHTDDGFTPIMPSDEKGEATTFSEKNDEDGSVKEVYISPPKKGEDKKHENENEKRLDEDYNSPNIEVSKTFPVHYDISKLCTNFDSNVENPCVCAPTKCLKSKQLNPSSKQVGAPYGDVESYTKDIEQDLNNVNIGPECKGTDFVNFEKHIQKHIGDLINVDFDAMELCDYLYQYSIMNRKTYEAFFDLSHSKSNSAIKDFKRTLMLFLSKPLPRDTLEHAFNEARCSHVFVDVFSSVGRNQS